MQPTSSKMLDFLDWALYGRGAKNKPRSVRMSVEHVNVVGNRNEVKIFLRFTGTASEIVRQNRDSPNRSMPVKIPSSSASSSFWADDFGTIRILSHAARRASGAPGAVLLVRDTLFLAARFGDQAVPEVLPNRPVRFHVDLYSHAVALIVSHELESRSQRPLPWHRLILWQGSAG
jgi:hypothetical protein